MSAQTKLQLQHPDYGVDAPHVMRNLFLFGALCVLLIFVTPRELHVGPANILWHQ